MAPKSDSLDLGFATAEAMAEEDVAEVIEKASQIVGDFTAQNSLPALDSLLRAAEAPAGRAVAEEARLLADEVVERNRVLRSELSRFMSLAEPR